MATYNTYTAEQIEFLRENAKGMSRAELTKLFNEKFGTDKSVIAIKSYCNARGFNSPSNGRFQKGNVSWQTGLSGDEYRSHFTEESFERSIHAMQEANKTAKIGDEILIDGVPWIVTSLDYSKPFCERRELKRRVVWEQEHGKIPKDHMILNLDGDQMNCDPSNLACVPAKYRPMLNKNRWLGKDKQITLTAIKWCELFYAIKEATNVKAD